MNIGNFDAAHRVADAAVCHLLGDDIPCEDIADAMLTCGLAVWASKYDRHADAESLLRTWAEVRDYGG